MEETAIPLAAFARAVNRSEVWILELCKRGVIPRNADGTIPVEAGKKAFFEHSKKTSRKGKTHNKKRGGEDVDLDAFLDESADNLGAETNVSEKFAKAKLAEKTYQARLKRLDFRLRNGELIEAADVAKEAQELAEKVRSKLLAIPPRIAGLCENRSAREIEELIGDAINEALKDLQKKVK